MPLAPGVRLGPYQVEAALGAGGMGEVYRARDTRLDRLVAIKVLPPGFSADGTAQQRFEREARLASSLNHPNIVTIYDIGEMDAGPYIAMELVDGETLHARLARGPVAVAEAVGLSAQIADGLAKAHDAGIVHRDLKPQNVMVTSDGLVKILDFGLGKLTAPLPRIDPEAETTADSATRPGVMLGTIGYMSPEQVAGRAAGSPSDQFALGAVLYELVTGGAPSRGTPPFRRCPPSSKTIRSRRRPSTGTCRTRSTRSSRGAWRKRPARGTARRKISVETCRISTSGFCEDSPSRIVRCPQRGCRAGGPARCPQRGCRAGGPVGRRERTWRGAPRLASC